ncbi:hypothetical protein [Symbiopectobacterium sp. RP]|uniref:hypothetical protein n=1 Tax=Symbiopectobacterium sp. RP TaxID=3248553 RepID=UPI003D2701D2
MPVWPRNIPANSIANRLKNDYIQCPDMWQKNTANCYQNNVAWLYLYAKQLLETGHKDEAVTWFYVGQLRWCYHLLAHPELPPDGEPAAMDALNATLGQAINEWAGGSSKA